MKLTTEKNTLLTALGHVQSVVERRNTIPILSNVLLEADGAVLTLSATDLDLAIVDQCAADVAQGGGITVPAHTLFEIVRKLPDGAQVMMETKEDGQLHLSAGRSQFKLACLPQADFPVMNEGDLPHQFHLGGADLRRLIDKTRFAMSTEETRYYLNGIFLHTPDVEAGGDQVLRAVATDGIRLARVDAACPDGAQGMPGVIIPRKAVGELVKLIAEVDDMIAIGLSDTKIRFAVNGAVLTSKLIDGSFPDYSRVIPVSNSKTLDIDCKPLAQGVDRVSTISSDKSRSVRLSVDDNKVVLSVTSPDAGAAVEEVEADYAAEALDIGFNSRFLMDILNQIEGERVTAHMEDAASPTLMADSKDSGAVYVLMPMRV